MKKLLPALLSIMFAVLIVHYTFAGHNRGADIKYVNIAPQTYLVEFTYYIDCGSITAPSSQTMSYRANGCHAGGTFTVNSQSVLPVNPYCNTVTTTCSNSSANYPDYEVHTYSGTVTLPTACDNWRISFRSTDWNSNANLATNSNLYTDAMIDNVNAANNTSPILTNDPLTIIYTKGTVHNKLYTYNIGAIEHDGDSLAYSFTEPLHDYNQPATYNTNYSLSDPFGINNGSFSIDPVTGAIQVGVLNHFPGVPNSYRDNYVVAVQIDEYRKDSSGVYQKIGHVRRDLNMLVINVIQNYLPELQSIIVNSSAESYNSVVEVEAGQPVNIQFTATDGDLSDQLSLSTNADDYFQNASLNITGSPASPIATLTLTPTLAQVRDYPYYIMFTAKDNDCPLLGFETQTIGLRVKSPGSLTGIKENLAKKYQLPTLLNTSMNDRLQLHPELTGATVNIYNHTGSLVKSISNYDNSWSANSVAAGLYIYSVEHQGLAQPITSKLLVVK